MPYPRKRSPTGRRKVRAPPPAIELALHYKMAAMLDMDAAPGWVWSHYPAGEKRTVQAGARLKRMGTKPGWPDLLLIAPGGARTHGLELKRKGSKPTDAQAAFGRALIAAGGVWAWTDDFDVACRLLRGWGALAGKVIIA